VRTNLSQKAYFIRGVSKIQMISDNREKTSGRSPKKWNGKGLRLACGVMGVNGVAIKRIVHHLTEFGASPKELRQI
jgi:hypothetical protein